MKLAVVGSRTITYPKDIDFIVSILDELISLEPNLEIVSGGAVGPDTIASCWAHDNGIPVKEFIPDWSKGRSAGFTRNKHIWEYCDAGVAFWDGISAGTTHSFGLAKKAEKSLVIFNMTTGEFYNNE